MGEVTLQNRGTKTEFSFQSQSQSEYQPLEITETQIAKMREIFKTEDLGPELKIVALKKEIAKAQGANNKGVFLADVAKEEEILSDVVVKIIKTGNWWFYRVNAISQLNIGMKYLGWDQVKEGDETDYAIVTTLVPGVDEKDPRHFSYFNRKTLRRLEEVFSFFIDVGVIFPSLDYLVDQSGEVHFIDYDMLRYKEFLSDDDKQDILEALNREQNVLITKLDPSWQEAIKKSFERMKWKVTQK